MRDPFAVSGGDPVSLPSEAEVEHADWPSLKRICESLGLNPKGRSAVVRMRAMDHLRRRARTEPWSAGRGHIAALLNRLGFPDLSENVWESTIQLNAAAPWVGLGQAKLASGLLGEAKKSFDRAVQMGDSSAHLHAAEALAAGGDFDRAVQSCELYVAAHPGDVRGLAMKAAFLARAGYAEEAARILQTTSELHPEIRGLARTMGTVLLRADRPEPASEALRAAAHADPRDIDAAINRGASLVLTGRTREAIGVLREALEVDARRPEALNNLGVAYLRLGQRKSGAVNIERAAGHLETPRILLNLAAIQETEDQPEDALGSVGQVLRMEPKDSEALAVRKRLTPKGRPRRTAGGSRGAAAKKTSARVRKSKARKDPKA
jgi:tetratricopeptide (TPR) repeat protein